MRLANDRSFNCNELTGMTVEQFIGYHEPKHPNVIRMIVLKLEEKELWQRFFLDAGIGFWEEWDRETAISDFEDDPSVDLAKKYSLTQEAVLKIVCTGSFDEPSSITFEIGREKLNYRFLNSADIDSELVLERIEQ